MISDSILLTLLCTPEIHRKGVVPLDYLQGETCESSSQQEAALIVAQRDYLQQPRVTSVTKVGTRPGTMTLNDKKKEQIKCT